MATQGTGEKPQLTDNPLKTEELHKLKDAYRAEKLKSLLRDFLPHQYPPSKDYNDAIINHFYGQLQEVEGSVRDALDKKDVERCIIALLASRGELALLAVHIYIALMEDITAEEIANIILLAGIYSGVGNFTRGLQTEMRTLAFLSRTANPNQPPKDSVPPAGIDAQAVVLNMLNEFTK